MQEQLADDIGPLSQYQKSVEDGSLVSDSHQIEIAMFMNGINDELKSYRRPEPGFFQKVLCIRVIFTFQVS